jgi:hypothetical protein
MAKLAKPVPTQGWENRAINPADIATVTTDRTLRLMQEAIANRIPAPSAVAVPPGFEVITYSEMDTFRQCPLKHRLAYRDRWAREALDGSPLKVGGLWHNVMEAHYRVLARWSAASRERQRAMILDACREAVWPVLHNPENGLQTEDQALCTWIYDGHVAMWGVDPDWEILAVERAGRIPMDGAPFMFQFKVDCLVYERSTRQILLIDHKSALNFSRKNEIDIDDQFGLYTWALRSVGVDVWGSVRSDARKQRNKGDIDGSKPMTLESRFQRIRSWRSDVELQNLFLDLYENATAAWGVPAVYRSSPSPTMCTWRCDFFSAHLLNRKGLPWDAILEPAGFVQKEAKHREYDETELAGGPS